MFIQTPHVSLKDFWGKCLHVPEAFLREQFIKIQSYELNLPCGLLYVIPLSNSSVCSSYQIPFSSVNLCTFSPLHPFLTPVLSPRGSPQTLLAWSACHPHDSPSVAPGRRFPGPPLAAAGLGCFSYSGCGEVFGWSCCRQIWMTCAGRCWASRCGMPTHSPPGDTHQKSMGLAQGIGGRRDPNKDFSLARSKTETEYHRLLYKHFLFLINKE